jgi:DNA-binding NtrC family response regulator
MVQKILIVDDDPTQRRLIQAVVEREGYEVEQAEGGEQALAFLESEAGDDIALLLLDLVMPDLDGMAVLERIKPKRPELPAIVLTAQSGIDVIVNVMRAGAVDFIPKPASPERLKVSMENALKMNALTEQVSRLTRRAEGQMTFDDMIAASAAMGHVFHMARRGAASNIPMLIEGESGVGKEMIARAIQGSSDRAGKPFVAVNCGAIPENLVESILFGHEKGAFTGAVDKHIGKFQEADGGTLFLDEIGELRADMQVKLLRAIQEGEIDPIGSRQSVKVDIRLVSATNRNLQEMVEQGGFREDLYYRLSVFPITVPPLRERTEDIPVLAEHFLAKFAATEGKPVRQLSPDAMDLLLRYDWRGNVRQLENSLFRAVVLCDGEELTVADFPQLAQSLGIPAPAAAANGHAVAGLHDSTGHVRPLAEVEADMIRLAIDKYEGQMSEVARRLGIGRSTLYRKVRDLGLEVRS